MTELENKLKQTLAPFLTILKDDESRDFVIQLIMRDVKAEIKDILQSFYYGEDLADPQIRQFYERMLSDFLEDLK